MTLSYDKLWNLMRANKMKKHELASAAKITQYTMAKLYNNKPVDLSVMMNICKVFHCDIGDLLEVKEEV